MTVAEDFAKQPTVFELAEAERQLKAKFETMNKQIEGKVHNGLPPTLAQLLLEPGAYMLLMDDARCICVSFASLHISQLGAWLECVPVTMTGERDPEADPVYDVMDLQNPISVPLQRVVGVFPVPEDAEPE